MALKTPQLVSGFLCCLGWVGGFTCFHDRDLCSPLPNLWQELETFSLLSNGTPAGMTDQVGVAQDPKCFPNFLPACLSSSTSKSSGLTHWGDPKQWTTKAPNSCHTFHQLLSPLWDLIHKGQDWSQLWRSVRRPSRMEHPMERIRRGLPQYKKHLRAKKQVPSGVWTKPVASCRLYRTPTCEVWLLHSLWTSPAWESFLWPISHSTCVPRSEWPGLCSQAHLCLQGARA